MLRRVVLFGVVGGLLIALLRYIEFRFLVIEHSVEIYGGLIALVFVVLGLGLGARLTRPAPANLEGAMSARVGEPVGNAASAFSAEPVGRAAPAFAADPEAIEHSGVTPRELEILGLIAAGHTNREIAERLFVSENTVKTHSSRLFDKLGVGRRTQAVQAGQRLGLIP